MNKVERKAAAYVNAGKVHVDSYVISREGAVEIATGFVIGSRRWRVSVSPAGSLCDCPFGVAHGVTSQRHSHDTALRLAAWQMERLHEQ